MNASKKVISDILNGGRILEIPFFQRAYVWDQNQWERLLEDMQAITLNKNPYFLGSVILKQLPTSTEFAVGDLRSIIDGQQRLTTLAIFFKVLCLHTGDTFKFDGRFRILNREKTIAIQHNHHDIASFNMVMNAEELNDIEGSGKILGAYNYFRKHISKYTLDYDVIMNNVMFVGIDLDEKEDEQQIFDTINSLGVRLTVAELLKNYLFSRDDIESYEKNWKYIFESDEETISFWDVKISAGRAWRQNIELFFYAFLQIKINEPGKGIDAEDKKQYSRFDALFNSYKSFIEKYDIDKDVLISEIRDYAALYFNNIDYAHLEQELPKDSSIERINALIFGLENTTLIPYVLYVLKKTENNPEERQSIFNILESYIMRRVVCRSNNKNYNNFFTDRLIGNDVCTADSLQELLIKSSGTGSEMPTDNDLLAGFMDSKITNKQAKGVLYMIESSIRDRSSQSTSLLGMDSYTLEHIMPKKWENHWEKIDDDEKRNFRNRKLLTLGNLTIITSSLNTSIRDSDWKTKLQGVGTRGGLKRFSSGIEITGDFLERSDWNEEAIEERAHFLNHLAQKIWKF